jgi:hypothetical protein
MNKTHTHSVYLAGDELTQWSEVYRRFHAEGIEALIKSGKNHVIIGLADWNSENSSVEFFIKPVHERKFQRFVKSAYKISPDIQVYAVHAQGKSPQ